MKCEYFNIYELVPFDVYQARGEKAWELIDSRMVSLLDRLRKNLNKPIMINDYHWGGNLSQRGIRTPDCPVYSKFSQHSFGRAVDFHVRGMTAHEVRKHIIQNIEDYQEIKFMEVGSDMNWVHIDVRNADSIRYWDKNTKLYVSEEDVVRDKL